MTATVFLVLLAGHLLGDWVAQSDWQATSKIRSWAALAAHVATYHLLMGALLLLPILRDGWPAWKALVVLLVSAATHAVIDRRWPVRALLAATASPGFATVEWGRDRRRPSPAPDHPGAPGRAARLNRSQPPEGAQHPPCSGPWSGQDNTRQSHTNSQPSGRLGDMRRIRIHRGKVLRDRHRLAVLALDPRDPDVVRATSIGRSGEGRTR